MAQRLANLFLLVLVFYAVIAISPAALAARVMSNHAFVQKKFISKNDNGEYPPSYPSGQYPPECTYPPCS
ncbi:hypothetical protein ZIOFF_038371 [Zingiber officinale]|uniref:Transmembrane protein n=1 Tax=Zingiber officinale TaxID=94328 RepID=A0A8J5FZA3_ZINOF|nr:hypothetical protein ZIOFF_038371 [Zingiber officinale]